MFENESGKIIQFTGRKSAKSLVETSHEQNGVVISLSDRRKANKGGKDERLENPAEAAATTERRLHSGDDSEATPVGLSPALQQMARRLRSIENRLPAGMRNELEERKKKYRDKLMNSQVSFENKRKLAAVIKSVPGLRSKETYKSSRQDLRDYSDEDLIGIINNNSDKYISHPAYFAAVIDTLRERGRI